MHTDFSLRLNFRGFISTCRNFHKYFMGCSTYGIRCRTNNLSLESLERYIYNKIKLSVTQNNIYCIARFQIVFRHSLAFPGFSFGRNDFTKQKKINRRIFSLYFYPISPESKSSDLRSNSKCGNLNKQF